MSSPQAAVAPPDSPCRDDNATTTSQATSGARATACPVCARPFLPVRRQAYCSTACRKTAYRRRHPAQAPIVVPAGQPRGAHTVYECAGCGARQLAQQRCPDCGVFGSSLGLGGTCPCCEETITLTDLDLDT